MGLPGAVEGFRLLHPAGPGRNLDPGDALGALPLLAVTGIFLAGAAGFRRDVPSLSWPRGHKRLPVLSVGSVPGGLPAGLRPARASTPWKRLIPGPRRVAALSLFLPYPGHVRPGLNTLLSAENRLRESDPRGCMVLLEQARREGFTGADIHNIRASAMAVAGMDFREVLLEFGLALEAAPESPTVWRNMSSFLWNYGRTGPAREAAAEAVRLNPSIRGNSLESYGIALFVGGIRSDTTRSRKERECGGSVDTDGCAEGAGGLRLGGGAGFGDGVGRRAFPGVRAIRAERGERDLGGHWALRRVLLGPNISDLTIQVQHGDEREPGVLPCR